MASKAFVPSLNLSAYCPAFLAVICSAGFSPGNGSAGISPNFAPATSLVNPPVQAGMEPSALPAFSAPMGVNVVLSFAASSGLTAANAVLAHIEIDSVESSSSLIFVIIRARLFFA
ncbi:hypothetical protein D3C76_1217790 [compost metagenome]